MLNALQANPTKPLVEVRAQTTAEGNGSSWVQIEIADNGTGFTAEAAQKAPTPFYTTRSVGLGLGLCVTRKIVETHRGTLHIPAPKAGQPGVVRISLPLASAPGASDKSGNGIH
jgi:two-component system, LuxR family, sensor kinase FixL